MAFNKKNYYKKVIKIQNIVREKQALGIMMKVIFSDYIEEDFCISYRTFSKYMNVPARRELKKLIQLEKELSEANTEPSKLGNEKQNSILSKSQETELNDTREAKAVLSTSSSNPISKRIKGEK